MVGSEVPNLLLPGAAYIVRNNDRLLDRMRARAHAVRTRAAIRRWEYRQRRPAGVWFRIRRVLADAKEAYVISVRDAERLIAEGYKPEACGAQLAPEKN